MQFCYIFLNFYIFQIKNLKEINFKFTLKQKLTNLWFSSCTLEFISEKFCYGHRKYQIIISEVHFACMV